MNEFPKGTRPEDTRAIDVAIDIDAPAADVWPYLSTSDGLSSWYVDVQLAEPKQGAAATLDFGGGMVVPAQIHTYEPGHKIRLGPPPDVDSPRVEEYRVTPRDGGGCTVRIVNWGFGEGADWDAEYDAVKKGWLEFLGVLKRVVESFRAFGRPRRVMLLSFGADPDAAWLRLAKDLGADALGAETPGAQVTLRPSFGPALTGTLDSVGDRKVGVHAATPTGGFVLRAAIECSMYGVMIGTTMMWFGDAAASAPADAWRQWFAQTFPPPPMPG